MIPFTCSDTAKSCGCCRRCRSNKSEQKREGSHQAETEPGLSQRSLTWTHHHVGPLETLRIKVSTVSAGWSSWCCSQLRAASTRDFESSSSFLLLIRLMQTLIFLILQLVGLTAEMLLWFTDVQIHRFWGFRICFSCFQPFL